MYAKNIIHIDIAVSAPFDDGGKVFVYYGSNSTTIIDTSVQQVAIDQLYTITFINEII